jgi:putative FmdB family regulatory protein
MPTYEYECTKCEHVFEKFQSMTAEHVKRCPECRCKVRRLFGTGAGFLFKGAPVSETDYRLSKSYKDGKKKDSAAADSSSTKSGSSPKKESKSTAKKATAAT